MTMYEKLKKPYKGTGRVAKGAVKQKESPDSFDKILASKGIGKKQGSPGASRKVFGQPARGLTKGYV